MHTLIMHNHHKSTSLPINTFTNVASSVCLYFLPIGIVLLIVSASIILYLPVFNWLLVKMSLANGYLHLFALLGLVSLGIYRLLQLKVNSKHSNSSNSFHFPVLFHSGAFIWISASVLYLFNEANVGFHTLSAALFIVYFYGLAGHFLSKVVWRSMLLPMLLLILVLPFEHYLDIYLGFPLRLLSAQWAGSVLQFTQLPTLTVESILMIDNKAAIVDLDCSGINSLWIGMIFYLLLTWIERYTINRRWLLIGFALLGLLVLSNVFRIVILVMLDLVFEMPDLAQLFHQSLGLLGFIISCLIVWWLLQKFVVKKTEIIAKASELKSHSLPQDSRPNLLSASAIVVIITLFITMYQPQTLTSNVIKDTKHTLKLPTKYPTKEIQLNQQEKSFFVSNHAQAQKYNVQLKLNNKNVTASMVFVWSRAWKTHHVPENCYLSQGYSISNKGLWNLRSTPQSAQPHNVRHLALDEANQSKTLHQTGAYWFQSANKSTPDYSSRVLDTFLHPNREWVMVSILWNSPVNPDEISPFLFDVKNTIKHSIENQSNEI